jgi:hypothetical protein
MPEFLMTSYIYPLEKPIVLCQNPSYILDNPRSPDEIELVSYLIEKAYQFESAFTYPPFFEEPNDYERYMSIERGIRLFFKNFQNNNNYFKKLFKSYKKEETYSFLARMWVVARFDDEGSIKEIDSHFDDLKDNDDGSSEFKGKTLVMLNDDHPLIKNRDRLHEYCHLLSLFLHTEEDRYVGRSFLLGKYADYEHFPDFTSLRLAFFTFYLGASANGFKKDEPLRWMFFHETLKILKNAVSIVNLGLHEKYIQKTEYVARMLKVAQDDVNDDKMKVLVLVGILELLLTHNPDFNRFNVEDSISKQFRLKTSILVYEDHPELNIYDISKRLKLIYVQRSNIAHGNFQNLEKFIKNLSKKEGQEEYFDDLISDLYFYLKSVLKKYLINPDYVNFLKEN